MRNFHSRGQVLIECPNTIFHLFVKNEDEISKVEIFMNNIRTMHNLSLSDIYNWCNRQGIVYYTNFNYHKELSIWNNVQLFSHYLVQKHKNMAKFQPA